MYGHATANDNCGSYGYPEQVIAYRESHGNFGMSLIFFVTGEKQGDISAFIPYCRKYQIFKAFLEVICFSFFYRIKHDSTYVFAFLFSKI